MKGNIEIGSKLSPSNKNSFSIPYLNLKGLKPPEGKNGKQTSMGSPKLSFTASPDQFKKTGIFPKSSRASKNDFWISQGVGGGFSHHKSPKNVQESKDLELFNRSSRNPQQNFKDLVFTQGKYQVPKHQINQDHIDYSSILSHLKGSQSHSQSKLHDKSKAFSLVAGESSRALPNLSLKKGSYIPQEEASNISQVVSPSIKQRNASQQASHQFSPIKLLLKELHSIVSFNGFEGRPQCEFEFKRFSTSFSNFLKEKCSPKCYFEDEAEFGRDTGEKLAKILTVFLTKVSTADRFDTSQGFPLTGNRELGLETEVSRLKKENENLRSLLSSNKIEANCLFTENSKLALSLEQIQEKAIFEKQNKELIVQMKQKIEDFEVEVASLKEEIAAKETRFQKTLDTTVYNLDQLKYEKYVVKSKLEETTEELSEVKKELKNLLTTERTDIIYLRRLEEGLRMQAEDISERMRQVHQQRETIVKIKESIGLIEENRKWSKTKSLQIEQNLSSSTVDVMQYLDRFNSFMKKDYITYSISAGMDRDPLSGNDYNLFKAMIGAQHAVSKGLESRNPLKFTAFDKFIVETLHFNKAEMEFMQYRKVSPNLFHLIRGDIQKYEGKVEKLFSEKFRLLSVLAIIRCILDSYYSEIMALENLEDLLPFSQFVFLWFENFEIDPISKKVKKTEETPQESSKRRLEFVIQLTSPIFLKVWDSYFFIESLCNHFSNDEMAYYLYLRYFIFQGLLQTSESTAFEYRLKADLDILKPILRLVDDPAMPLSDEIFNSIENCVSIGQGLTRVDIHLVLRVFLEVYICKKACKVKSAFDAYQIFKSEIVKKKGNNQDNIFESFRTVMRIHFEHANNMDILKLYSAVINFAQGGYQDIRAFYIAGQTTCIFTLHSCFKVLSKIDYLRKLNLNTRCRDFRLETRLGVDYQMLDALLPEAKLSKPENQSLSAKNKNEKAHQALCSRLMLHNNEEALKARSSVIRMAEAAGSVTLLENYSRLIGTLSNSNKHSSLYATPMSLSFVRLKNIERIIVGCHLAVNIPRFASQAHEADYLIGLINEPILGLQILKQIDLRKAFIDKLFERKSLVLQNFCTDKLNAFYKMIIELIKINRTKMGTG